MASGDAPPTAAAGANSSIRDAPVVWDLPSQEHQHTQHITNAPALLNSEEDDQHIASGLPRRSLFGPFPELTDPSNANQESTESPEARQSSVSHPPDQIEPSKENRREISPPILNFDAQDREPLRSVQINKPSTHDKSLLPPLTREKTAPAIGPATDKPSPVPKESDTEGPALYITLLLSSTGARHPYKLDEKYLRKRNVTVDGNNPINISLYKLKELILRDWRDGEFPFNHMMMLWLYSSSDVLTDLEYRMGSQTLKSGLDPLDLNGKDAQ